MIHTLAFGNYRSLRDLKIPLRQLNLITGANGSGKSNVYRALRLLVDAANGELGRALAREGGMPSALWAGPQRQRNYRVSKSAAPAQGTVRSEPVRLSLGFAADDFAYELALGLPSPGTAGPTLFALDPEVKHEWIRECRSKSRAVLLERAAHTATVRDADGKRVSYPLGLDLGESVLAQISEPHRYPEVSMVRERIRGWRFYHQFRTDAESPLRLARIGTRTPVLHHDGTDLVAALQTIREIGDDEALDGALAEAFDGARLRIDAHEGRLGAALDVPGVLRPLGVPEWSDGTLRYVCLLAALLSPRPPGLLVLNEPEASLHPRLLAPLAQAIARGAEATQVVVVTHAEPLIVALEGRGAANTLELVREDGETRIAGQGLLDEPSWPH